MHRAVQRLTIGTCMLALIAGCDGDSSPGPSGPSGSAGSGTITAQINGAAWAGDGVISNAQFAGAGGLLLLTGINTGSYSVAINIDEVSGPGTITLHNTFPLRFAVVTTLAGGSWSSMNTGDGSVTITSLTASRVAGTFSFTAGPSANSSSDISLTVTGGQFDLPIR